VVSNVIATIADPRVLKVYNQNVQVVHLKNIPVLQLQETRQLHILEQLQLLLTSLWQNTSGDSSWSSICL
jgi:hypothetical protein